MSAVQGLLDRAIDGHGAVVGVVGPPGIGKSRLVRDLSAMASARGVEVFSTFCESHTRQIPFHAIARLLRVAFGTAWRVHDHLAGDRFDELRQLCTPAGDKASLAISMAGLVMDHALQGRMREGSQLASEAWALIESVGDATLTVGLANTVIFAKLEPTEYCDALRWSQAVIDLADGDRSKGNFLIGSPLALAFTTRGNARFLLGRPGWRDDLRHGLAMALSADPMSYAFAVAYVYFPGILLGVLAANERATREIEDALRIAERSTDDLAVAFARGTLGIALVHRQAAADRDRGQRILAEVGDVFLRQGHNLGELPIVNVVLARDRERRGDRHDGIPRLCAAADHLFREGQALAWAFQQQVSWWRHCSTPPRR
jgi:hypothetical protein